MSKKSENKIEDKNIKKEKSIIKDKEKKEVEEKKDIDEIVIKQRRKIIKKNEFGLYELIMFSIIIIFVTIFLTIFVYRRVISDSDIKINGKEKSKNDISEIKEVYDLINSSYYKDVDSKKLVDAAINGMLESLGDPHTNYLNVSETENFNELMNGSYEGIGAEISIDANNNIIVYSVFKNSPAYENGLKFNDIILKVNGKDTKGLTTTEVVTLIKDPKKPVANMIIKRDDKEIEFNIKKRVVVIESVESKIINKNNKKVGYILVNNFANNTYEQFKNNIEDLEKENISGLVIDVRGNSGGYLHCVTSMLDLFLSKGKVVYQIQDKKSTLKYTAESNESRNYPVTVLIDKGSASASEILAISMQESYGASVVGVNSYGKGTVQVTKDLKSGAMIKYTIQKWLSPKGNWINDVGVTPNYKVELSKDYENNPVDENDNQLQKALDIVSK